MTDRKARPTPARVLGLDPATSADQAAIVVVEDGRFIGVHQGPRGQLLRVAPPAEKAKRRP